MKICGINTHPLYGSYTRLSGKHLNRSKISSKRNISFPIHRKQPATYLYGTCSALNFSRLSTYEVKLRKDLGLRKKLKKSDWPVIYQQWLRREGRPTAVYLNSTMIPWKRVWKEIRRSGARGTSKGNHGTSTLLVSYYHIANNSTRPTWTASSWYYRTNTLTEPSSPDITDSAHQPTFESKSHKPSC